MSWRLGEEDDGGRGKLRKKMGKRRKYFKTIIPFHFENKLITTSVYLTEKLDENGWNDVLLNRRYN